MTPLKYPFITAIIIRQSTGSFVHSDKHYYSFCQSCTCVASLAIAVEKVAKLCSCLVWKVKECMAASSPTDPQSQFWSFKIRPTAFLKYAKIADLLITRLWNCERAGRVPVSCSYFWMNYYKRVANTKPDLFCPRKNIVSSISILSKPCNVFNWSNRDSHQTFMSSLSEKLQQCLAFFLVQSSYQHTKHVKRPTHSYHPSINYSTKSHINKITTDILTG